MRKQGFGHRPLRVSRVLGILVFLGSLALLGGMLWQVGLVGVRASFQAMGLWVLPFLLLDGISVLLHTVGWAACFQPHQPYLRLWFPEPRRWPLSSSTRPVQRWRR